MGPEFREQQRWLSRVTLEMGVALMDPTDVLDPEEANCRPMHADYDSHMTPAGYERFAVELTRAFQNAGH